jgi:hypothetical protein
MKLRLDGRSVRLRLNAPEVAQVASEGSISTETVFPDGRVLSVRLEIANVDAVSATFEPNMILVRVPERAGREWSESAQTGIYADAGGLAVLIEKDRKR